MDDIIGEEARAPAGSVRLMAAVIGGIGDGGGGRRRVGFRGWWWRTERFWRPRCTNGGNGGDGRGNHGLGTRLSEMWGKLQKYPHPF